MTKRQMETPPDRGFHLACSQVPRGRYAAKDIRGQETSIDLQHCPSLRCRQFVRGFDGGWRQDELVLDPSRVTLSVGAGEIDGDRFTCAEFMDPLWRADR